MHFDNRVPLQIKTKQAIFKACNACTFFLCEFKQVYLFELNGGYIIQLITTYLKCYHYQQIIR